LPAELLALPCTDELSLLALNYTSGTTGRPKGVMYSHRGAYLQALAMALHTGLNPSSQYLWTLPMFHCDGWCFPWAVSVGGATHVCLPRVEPSRIWELLRNEGITHFSAAPTVLTMILSADEAAAGPVQPRVEVPEGTRELMSTGTPAHTVSATDSTTAGPTFPTPMAAITSPAAPASRLARTCRPSAPG